MKRKITSICLVLILFCLMAIPSFASVVFNYHYESYNSGHKVYNKNPFFIGEENRFYMISPAYSGFEISGEVDESVVTIYFTLDIDTPSRIWVGTFSQFGYSEQWDYDFYPLSDYYVSGGDIVLENYPLYSVPVNFYQNLNDFAVGDITSTTRNVLFKVFDNVPAGSYQIRCQIQQRVVGHYYGAGVFLSDPSVPMGASIIDDFKNGLVSFDDALDSIYQNYLTEVGQSADIESKQFITQTAIYYNQTLTETQNIVSGHSIKEFHESSSQTLSSFRNGDLTFPRALTSLQSHYETAVGSATTPEDITAINQQYFYEVSQMQDFAVESTSQEMQNSTHFAEDEIGAFEDKLAQINDMFDISAFEDLYQNLLWSTEMFDSPSGLSMRSLLDTFLTTGWLRYYIIVPLVCTILGVLLNTSIIGLYFSSKRGSK